MVQDKSNGSTSHHRLASLFRGIYGRVAQKVGLDASYVSRVARGERRSEKIEAALEREMQRIMKMALRMNHNGNGAGANGAGRDVAMMDGARKQPSKYKKKDHSTTQHHSIAAD